MIAASARSGKWPRILGALLALLLVSAAQPSLAQEGSDDEFLEEDLFLDDDFLEPGGFEEPGGEQAEAGEEAVQRRPRRKVEIGNPWVYWGFNVPVDVLVLRPIAALDVMTGSLFFATIAPVQGAFESVRYALTSFSGPPYFDRSNMQQALQQTVLDPYAYLAERPLGQLTTDF